MNEVVRQGRRVAGRASIVIALAACLPLDGHAATLSTVVLTPGTEGSTNATVAVQLAYDVGENPAPCQVDGTLSTQDINAIAGSDYQTISAPYSLTLTPADALVRQQFTIPIIDDAIAEPGEAFNASISATILPGVCSASVNVVTDTGVPIADDDQGNAEFVFSATVLSVNENAGNAVVQVVMNGAASLQPPFIATVDVVTQDGTANGNNDFSGVSTTLQFDETTLSQTVTIPLTNDTIAEPSESFSVVLSNASATLNDQRTVAVGLPSPVLIVTIVDDDVPGTLQFAATTLTAPETGGPLTVSVNRVGGTTGAVSVDYAASAGTATAGADFTAVTGTLNWAAGDGAAKTFAVPILNDTLIDPNETIALTLTNPTGGATSGPSASITIQDDEVPIDAGGDITLTTSAGATVTSTFFVTGAPPLGLTASLGTVNPAVLNAPGNVTYSYAIPAGTPAGSTLNDTVTVTDQGGNVATKRITLQVNAAAARNLSAIASLTPNQRALANWFDAACPRLATGTTPNQRDLFALCTNLRNPTTTDAQAVVALDAINPEELIGVGQITLQLATQQHGNLQQRINALRSGATGIDLAGLDLTIDGQAVSGVAIQSLLDTLTGGAASADDFGRWGLFANGRINYGDKDQTDNQAGFDFDTTGITTGVDYRFRENFIVGAALGYSRIKTDFDQSAGHLDIDTWNGSLFGTYFSADKFYVDAALNYGDNSYDSVRRIVYTDAGGTVDRTANGDSDGMEASASLSGGYDFTSGAWTFGPHAGTDYHDVDVDEVVETGADGLNTIVDDQNARSFTLNAGGHLSYVFTPSWGVLIPHLRLDLVHEFEDSRELVGIQLAADPFAADPTDPTPSINLQTDRPDADYVVWSTGVSAQFINGISGFVNYRSMAGYDDLTFSEVTLGMRWERSF